MPNIIEFNNNNVVSCRIRQDFRMNVYCRSVGNVII